MHNTSVDQYVRCFAARRRLITTHKMLRTQSGVVDEDVQWHAGRVELRGKAAHLPAFDACYQVSVDPSSQMRPCIEGALSYM